jgi:hypothetical protein
MKWWCWRGLWWGFLLVLVACLYGCPPKPKPVPRYDWEEPEPEHHP